MLLLAHFLVASTFGYICLCEGFLFLLSLSIRSLSPLSRHPTFSSLLSSFYSVIASTSFWFPSTEVNIRCIYLLNIDLLESRLTLPLFKRYDLNFNFPQTLSSSIGESISNSSFYRANYGHNRRLYTTQIYNCIVHFSLLPIKGSIFVYFLTLI